MVVYIFSNPWSAADIRRHLSLVKSFQFSRYIPCLPDGSQAKRKKSKTMDGHHNLEHHQAANIPPKTTTWIFMLDHLMCKLLSKWLSESVWELGSSAVEMLELPERVEVVTGMGFERVERRKVGVQNYLLGFISQIEHLWFFLTGVVKGRLMSEANAGWYKRNSGRILDRLLNEVNLLGQTNVALFN